MEFNWLNEIFGQKTPPSKSLWEQDIERCDPTKPINFGHKWVWAAVKTEDSEAVMNALNLGKIKQANWVEGTLLKDKNSQVFILPPIQGWTLISGWGLPTPDYSEGIELSQKLMNSFSSKFGEAQIFGNHRVSSVAFWMKSIKGTVTRLYCMADGNNYIIGLPTRIELQWDLMDLSLPESKEEGYWDRTVYPDAKHVLEVAENWSINPMKLEEMENIGIFGYTGTLRK